MTHTCAQRLDNGFLFFACCCCRVSMMKLELKRNFYRNILSNLVAAGAEITGFGFRIIFASLTFSDLSFVNDAQLSSLFFFYP